MTDKKRLAEIIVFAGPNGSGKSTITETLRPAGVDYINADEIKKVLHCTDLEAAQYAEKDRENHLANGLDFCFETVLSTERNLLLLQKAKADDYFIRSHYVITADPEINVERVQQRVANGGHDVPKEKIISRYYRSARFVKNLVGVSDVCNIYDNTHFPFRFFKKRKDEYFYSPCESWEIEDIRKLTGIDKITKKDLNDKNPYWKNFLKEEEHLRKYGNGNLLR
jgi:predicted ABC-type ATPase